MPVFGRVNLRGGGRQKDERCITICPVGSVDRRVLDFVAAAVHKGSHLPCRAVAAVENPAYAFDAARCQYDSKAILKRLKRLHNPHSLKILGVADVDLFIPILKYVFGLAEIQGRCAVISLVRLRPQFYDAPPDPELFLARLEKTALHELGHTFGLTHCRDRRCVMCSSTRIQDTDAKGRDFCPTCEELLAWHLGRR